MKATQNLEEVDRRILDIISHYGSLTFWDLWDEIGEDDNLKAQIITKEEALRKLEFLVAQGLVEHLMEEEGIKQWTLKNERTVCN